MKEEKVKKIVRDGYAKIAKKEKTSRGSVASCCSGTSDMSEEISRRIGYSEEEMSSVPTGVKPKNLRTKLP